MTRDEIYDHLAQVYLGKKTGTTQALKKKEQFSAWLLINIGITVVIFASSVYGLTAFLTKRGGAFQDKIIYALHHGPIRVTYNLNYPFPPVKTFSLSVPEMNASKYRTLQFSIRGMDDGWPGIVRVEMKNRKNEVDSVIIKDVRLDWNAVRIPLDEFEQITDWSNVSDVSFILESWNAQKKKGTVLIDDVCFSS
ncbi:MAG: hypothetical protein Q8Q08_07910 [Candidatus Omnitrophota bacterium]|nr:hypothetical protein [Candidatus Omnitrophota bacterium]MDZ4243106.1 hypothetical protein [Candidatus Omnitrophota bacterium]